jgi:hypothetical protein
MRRNLDRRPKQKQLESNKRATRKQLESDGKQLEEN